MFLDRPLIELGSLGLGSALDRPWIALGSLLDCYWTGRRWLKGLDCVVGSYRGLVKGVASGDPPRNHQGETVSPRGTPGISSSGPKGKIGGGSGYACADSGLKSWV